MQLIYDSIPYLLIELINTSAGCSSLLLASVERMALGANLNVNVLLRGTCYERRFRSCRQPLPDNTPDGFLPS